MTVTLNDSALHALRMLLTHRAVMHSPATTRERDRDDAREQVRSYAVEVVNEILREHPELQP